MRRRDGCPYTTMTSRTWHVTAADGGATVDITADDVPDGITAQDHSAGLAYSLRNLAGYLER